MLAAVIGWLCWFQFALPRGERRGRRRLAIHRRRFNSRSREGSDSLCWHPQFGVGVSIRAPARGATLAIVEARGDAGVSIRAPARGATTSLPTCYAFMPFQFALPRGERRNPSPCFPGYRGFNSRSREGSDVVPVWKLGYFPRFNSRSREGSDSLPRTGCLPMPVSIRAPARGATGRVLKWVVREAVSIRAPARGATNSLAQLGQGSAVSIRAPARGATPQKPQRQHRRRVSIRAPARGATPRTAHVDKLTGVSIRAPARGATRHWAMLPPSKPFQFALPRGERPMMTPKTPIHRSFNSRSREGSDIFHLFEPDVNQVSIRAPARGATWQPAM